MTPADLKLWHERYRIGDMVRHYGTKQWGRVIEVKPTRYGVELVVERVADEYHGTSGPGCWEGARIDLHQRDGKPVYWHWRKQLTMTTLPRTP